jgi:hypothetical protein
MKKNIFKSKCLVILFIVIFIILFSSLSIPYHTIFYENVEFPVWTDAYGIWSFTDEQWLMRGFDSSNRNDPVVPDKKRNKEIVDKYILDGALFYAGTRAWYESTHFSENPYSIGLTVYGLSKKHRSFTIKQINVNSPSGNDLSHLANSDLPKTIILEREFPEDEDEAWLVRGYYNTEAIFNFLNEPIILEFSLEINGIDGSVAGKIIFELTPIENSGVIEIPD